MIMADEDGSRAERASLPALFVGFLKVALWSVGGGGGIVFARRLVVEQRRWIGDGEFADMLSLCQFMPGPNMVGIAVCVGSRLRGPAGALAGVAGFTAIPLTISFSFGTWLLRNTDLALLQGVLGGVSAAAAGLLIGTGLRMLGPHRDRPMALCFAALAFGGLVFTKLPLLAILLALAPLSVTIAAMAGARAK
jgi:chromate transporter